MKFKIDFNGKMENRVLRYIIRDYSFSTVPLAKCHRFNLCVNMLELTINWDEGKVVSVDGYCPYGGWKKTKLSMPEYQPGALLVEINFEPIPGIVYPVTDREHWPMHVDKTTGWVCIGDYLQGGPAVEFIKNCVAVVSKGEGDLLSLWLKPKYLERYS